ncbi:MAG: glycosyltransferase [Anaerolineaceae bacterium]|nr:glycosyltransferase [Anaerolineaceae bacterium]
MAAAQGVKTRVAFLVRSLEYGGAERQLAALVTRMDRQRFEPAVLCFYPGGEFEAEIQGAGVPVIHIGKTGRWDWLRFFVRLVRKLKELRPHILHGYLETPNILSVLLKPFLPGVRVVFGLRASNMNMILHRYPWVIRLPYAVQPFFARGASLCIANSQAGKAFWCSKGIPEEKTLVIPNGFNTQKFIPNLALAAPLRDLCGVPGHTPLIGAVGRLDPPKGCEVFLKAAALLISAKPEVRFLWVGDGPPAYRAELVQLAASLGVSPQVVWLGARPDVARLYNAFDIFCSSSLGGEGFPNVLAEAMACGIFCVATSVGDTASILNGEGFIVPPGDPQALAAALQRALDLPPEVRQQSGERSRRRIMEEYSMDKMVNRTQDALVRLTSHPKQVIK